MSVGENSSKTACRNLMIGLLSVHVRRTGSRRLDYDCLVLDQASVLWKSRIKLHWNLEVGRLSKSQYAATCKVQEFAELRYEVLRRSLVQQVLGLEPYCTVSNQSDSPKSSTRPWEGGVYDCIVLEMASVLWKPSQAATGHNPTVLVDCLVYKWDAEFSKLN